MASLNPMPLPTRLENSVQKLSLRRKILIPFFLIVIIFGCIVSYGTYRLIQEALISTANQRLTAIQEIVFREIKKQEFLLTTYANIIEMQQAAGNENHSDPLWTLQQDKLLKLLGEGNITAILAPAKSKETFANKSGVAHANNRPVIRFLTSAEVPALLSISIPLQQKNGDQDLLLQTPIDSTFLQQIVAPFNTGAAIIDLQRQSLVTTAGEISLQGLGDAQMAELLGGEKISQTVHKNGYHRQLYSAIPLGSREIVILAVDLPLSDLDQLMKTLATRAGMTILVALGVGAFIFYRLIRTITMPLKDLLLATREISNGNLGYRITGKMTGEFQQLADSFNEMINRIDILFRERADQEKNLALANEQLHFNHLLAEKKEEIERTNQELRIHLREISMLLQLNQVMNSTLEIGVMFDRTLTLLGDFLGSSQLVLFLYHPETEELRVRQTIGSAIVPNLETTFKLREGVTGAAAQAKELLYIQDIGKDGRYLHYKNQERHQGSMVAAPIISKDCLLGVLNLHKAATEAFNETELSLIKATTNQLAIAIENSQLYEKMRTLSNTDALTNIPNRRYFQTILQREFAHAQRYNSSFSIIMVDIDHFKRFNDTFGHLNGDLALARVATLLRQNTRGIDLVARFGGEEFIILLASTGKENAVIVAEKLRHAVASEEFLLSVESGERAADKITISQGIAEYPNDSKGIETLVDMADRALYRAKKAGRNCTVCWNDVAEE